MPDRSFQLRIMFPVAVCLLTATPPVRAEIIPTYRTMDILVVIFGGESLGVASGFDSMPAVIDTQSAFGPTGGVEIAMDDALAATLPADAEAPGDQIVATGFPTAMVTEFSINGFGLLERGDLQGMIVRPMSDLHRLWIATIHRAPVFVESEPTESRAGARRRVAPRPSAHAVRAADMLTSPHRSR